MAIKILMPKLSDTMEEGTIISWYMDEGEEVKSGDAIGEVETDKAVMDLQSFSSGILRKKLLEPGQAAPIGELIAVLGTADEDISDIVGGAAIGFISSAAGLGWEKNLAVLKELLATPDFDSAVAFIQQRELANYYWMKQAVCAYVASQAFPMLKRGIRINAICPGPTDTPLAQANKDVWLAFGADYRKEAAIEA